MVKQLVKLLSAVTIIATLGVSVCFAGLMYQDFEPDNGSTTYGWSTSLFHYSVDFSPPATPIHVFSGLRSWRLATNSHLYYWPATGIASQVQTWDVDFDIERNDRFVFWFYNLAQWGGHHTVGVTFFDNGLYASDGFEVWTTNHGIYGSWSKLTVLFSQLPPDFDLEHIHHVELMTYWPHKYYFDDIASVREDRVYQAFEPRLRNNAPAEEFGWKWNDDDTVGFSVGGEPVYEGEHSWKLTTAHNWSGTGLQSQEKKLIEVGGNWEQSFWHVDLHPEKNDRLLLSVYGLPENEMDNNLAVQLYDHGAHFTDETKVVAWTKKAAQNNHWTRLEVPFSELPSTLNLNDLNKIQLQQYWPGTYYFDDLRATGPVIKINEDRLSQGIVKWEPIEGAGTYILEESRIGPDGPWMIAYKGPRTRCNVTRVTKLWYRVRWQEPVTGDNPIPYISVWSDVAEYVPAPLVISKGRLTEGFIEWNAIPQADIYEVEVAATQDGPWRQIYRGRFPHRPLSALPGEWYRVRGLNTYRKPSTTHYNIHEASSGGKSDSGKNVNNKRVDLVTDVTPWSVPQMHGAGTGFLRTAGTILKDQDGTGNEVLLQGVNLGGLLLIEQWMTGIGAGDDPPIEDDWTIRDVLTARFGEEGCDELLTTYQEEYIKSIDFDKLKNMRVNFVRLPIFYRILQDDDGNWITNELGEIDFSRIDRIVNACADRDIYVMLDLHGAPGGQSAEAHTGRLGFNRLFEDSPEGEEYRNRTVALWEAIADRYKNTTTVCAYDLLNEPIGAPTPEILWDMYDRIYDAIRAIDTDHIIVMEGIWDWDTLPDPSTQGWDNVLYQFHYYLWDHDEDVAAHMNFIDQKIADAQVYQAAYNVPVLVGEFFGFSMKPIWEYYVQKFNEQHWSWSSWSYKFHNSPSEWGLYNHSDYNLELPKLREVQGNGGPGDSYEVLLEKFMRYGTNDYHSRNISLQQLFKEYLKQPITTPYILELTPETILEYGSFTVQGMNFGETQGDSVVLFEGTSIPIISWSDTLIHVYLPSSASAGRLYGMVTVQTPIDTSNEAVLHVIQPPEITRMLPESASRGTEIFITGRNFRSTEGEIQFYPAPGSSNYGFSEITFWSDRLIKCIVPDDAISGPGTVRTPYGSAVFSFSVI
ncbi:cellulase family glycosylhydrolase [Candidatus Omnitrophota bacterium]